MLFLVCLTLYIRVSRRAFELAKARLRSSLPRPYVEEPAEKRPPDEFARERCLVIVDMCCVDFSP